jgi:hypothetical protein
MTSSAAQLTRFCPKCESLLGYVDGSGASGSGPWTCFCGYFGSGVSGQYLINSKRRPPMTYEYDVGTGAAHS